MKLGAQFYGLREKNKTPEGLRESFKAMKEIGYEVAQMSAICKIEPERLMSFSEEFSLPIVCTHSPIDRIVNDTEALIKEHKIYGCGVIGLGSLPIEYHGSIEAVRKAIEMLRDPVKRITDAGMQFSYHNHAFDFDDIGGTCILDLLVDELPDIGVILDTYWVEYAGQDLTAYIEKLGAKRLVNVHYKDMESAPQGKICSCGAGVLDFRKITDVCERVGVKNVLVEQDNAPSFGDEYEQMRLSFNHLRPIITKEK